MKKRIFRSMCLLSAMVVLLTATLIAILLYNDSYNSMKTEVRLESEYLQAGLEISGENYFSRLDQNVLKENRSRITLIAPSGEVLYESSTDEAMENHKDRPEVQAALANGTGEDSRMSKTFSAQTYYYAVKLEDGNVLRVSSTMNSVFLVWVSVIPTMLAIVGIVFGISLLLAHFQTKRIVKPINELNLELPT